MKQASCYEIGGFRMHLEFANADDEAMLTSYEPFRVEDTGEALIHVAVCDGEPLTELGREIGQFDSGGSTTGVYRLDNGGYAIVIHDASGTCCATLQSDALFQQCHVTLHTHKPHRRHYALNNALMMTYAFATADHQTMLMHASVVRWNGKGYLMTAPSGTGKSTHTSLWRENIPGCDLMNDDNPVVRVIGDQAIVYGSPWSGKTPCYRNIQAPIGALVRLWQKPENSIRRLGALDGFVHLLSAMSNMKWDKRVNGGICDSVTALLRLCGMWELGCLPNAAAAHLCHETVTRSHND